MYKQLNSEMRRMSTMPNAAALKKGIRTDSHRQQLFDKERGQAARQHQTMQRKHETAQDN